jgi:hypothetical protein
MSQSQIGTFSKMNKKITFNLLTNSLNFQVCLSVLFPLNNIMKKALISTFLLTSLVSQINAALIFGGDFQMYKPGSGNTVTADFATPTSYGSGVGSNLQVSGGSVNYSDSSAPGVFGDNIPDIDLPGWTTLQGSVDLQANGMGGSTGMNLFALWGGDGRLVTAGSVGTIIAGQDYTITTMVAGPGDGTPIAGPLAFHLRANGVQLTPTSLVNPTGPYALTTFQQISRTYDAASLAAYAGQSLTIVIGVEDANDFGNRVIFDDVSLVSVPEPTSALLGSLSVLVLLRRRRKA